MNTLQNTISSGWRLVCTAVLGLLMACPVSGWAAVTDIAGSPLPTYVSTVTKPNILFVLDNSGSMGWDYMPDDVKDAATSHTTTYGYKSAQCNGVAYDPTFTYAPPLKDDGSSYPNASFTNAAPNGFGPTLSGNTAYNSTSTVTTGSGSKSFVFSSGFLAGLFNGFNFLGGLPPWSVGDIVTAVDSYDDNHWVIGTITGISNAGICLISCTRTVTINVTSYNGTDSASDWKVNELQFDSLANSTYYVYNSTGSQTKMGWTYNGSGVVNSTFKNECISHTGSPTGETGDGKFTGVVVTSASSEAQNYANWYSYYRTRMLMMRSAAGRAFQPLTNRYRIGFSTINDTGVTESNSLSVISAGNAFLNVRDFDSAQRALFLQRLYNTTPSGGTPLRSALAKAGQYYAKKVSGQSYDPVQYACQRSYAFLSTDGYWNGSNAKQLDRTTDIGQQDAADVRPFSDGGSSTSTTVTTETVRTETRTPVNLLQNYTRIDYSYAVGSCFSPASGCSCLSPVKKTNTPYTSAATGTGTKLETQDQVTTTTTTTLTIAGVSTPSTTVAGPTSSGVTTTNPAAPSPSVWVAGSVSSSCISSGASRPATDGGPYASGGLSVTASGPAAVVSLPATIVGPNTTVVGGAGGTANTLADVAEYYYNTDLRTATLSNCTGSLSSDVCDNASMTASGRDTATWQHMSTFTLGLGVNGTLAYDRYYLEHASVTTSSYYKLLNGTLEWPAPATGYATTIDDLWHAAVNGRGQYFGAQNATDLTAGLASALAGMGRLPGAGGRPATSTGTPSDTNHLVYVAAYTTVDWTGDVSAYTVGTGGALSSPLSGTAAAGVDGLSARGTVGATDRRNIYYRKPGTTVLSSFTYTNLNADTLGTFFTNFCTKSMSDSATVYPLQCAGLSAGQLTLANNGTHLVDWLRGANAYEESNASNPLFRGRVSALGDIVNSSPVYVAAPLFSYSDTGYANFKSTQSARKAVIYVGSNDGMLHAFSAAGSDLGAELWAFVPTAVIPKMNRLANADYANAHQYLVDASPVVGDIYVGGSWKTILVGGLGAGGKSYYALDVTNPTSPQLLWEFFETTTATAISAAITAGSKDADLGLSYGNPVIVKRGDGTWVVAFSSGYNNTGLGRLYVLNANTGSVLSKIATTAGSAITPSGLGRISAWIDSSLDNTAKRFYGGDLLGNVWRFDIDSLVPPYGAAQRLALLQVGGVPQPITTRMILSDVRFQGASYPTVFVGTGRYLGLTDLTDATIQAIYAIKDPLTATDWGDVRLNTGMAQRTMSGTATARTLTANTGNWSTGIGWRMDLISSKERVVVDMNLSGCALLAKSLIPGSGGTCTAAGGSGWAYTINTGGDSCLSGTAVVESGSYMSSAAAGDVLTTGTDGSKYVHCVDSNGSVCPPVTVCTGSACSQSTPATFKRASWRELIDTR